MATMVNRDKLTCDHEIALTNLIELIRDLGLFEVGDDGDLITTGKMLDLEHFSMNDWLLCLDAIGEKKNPFKD